MSHEAEQRSHTSVEPLSAHELRDTIHPNRKKSIFERYSRKQQMGAAAGLLAITATLGIGGAKWAENTRNHQLPAATQPTAEAPAVPGPQESATNQGTPEAKPVAVDSETRFASYLDTLTPQQKAQRASLSPDNLVGLSADQLTKAFTIKSAEVTGADGKVDPTLFAEAVAARNDAIFSSGCTSKEYDKWGGTDKIGTDTISKIVNNYFVPETTALFGHAGDPSSAVKAFTNCEMTDQLINSGSPLKPYHLRSTVDKGSIKATNPANFTFNTIMTDNINTDEMQSEVGLTIKPTMDTTTWTVSGVETQADGTVSAKITAQTQSNNS